MNKVLQISAGDKKVLFKKIINRVKYFGLFLISTFIYDEVQYNIVEHKELIIMKKITKKEYEKLINCEHYYVTPFIGTFEDLNDFLSKETLRKYTTTFIETIAKLIR